MTPLFSDVALTGGDMCETLNKALENTLGGSFTLISTVCGCSNSVYILEHHAKGNAAEGESVIPRKYVLHIHNPNAFQRFKCFDLERACWKALEGSGVGCDQVYLFPDAVLTSFVEGDFCNDAELCHVPFSAAIARTMRRMHTVCDLSVDPLLRDAHPLQRYLEAVCSDASFIAEAGKDWGLTEADVSSYFRDCYYDENIERFLRGASWKEITSSHRPIPCENVGNDAEVTSPSNPLGSLSSLCWPCLTHNDLHSGNIVFQKREAPCPTELSAKFIDWEYSGVSYNLFDICCYFMESTGIDVAYGEFPCAENRKRFYTEYFLAQEDGDVLRTAIPSCDDHSDREGTLSLVDTACMALLPLVCAYWAAWGRCSEELATYAERRARVAACLIQRELGTAGLSDGGASLQEILLAIDCARWPTCLGAADAQNHQ